MRIKGLVQLWPRGPNLVESVDGKYERAEAPGVLGIWSDDRV
jgi:hypothetical protein